MNSLRTSATIALTAVALLGFACDTFANAPAEGGAAPASNLLTANPRLQQLLAEANRASGPEEILRLADAGADASVIQTYVEHSGRRYDLDADQIIQLHKLGVSPGVISAMIRRGVSHAVQSPAPAPTPIAPMVIQATATAPQPASTVTYIRHRPRSYPIAYRPLYVSDYSYSGYAPAYYGYGGFGSYCYRPSYWNYRPAWRSDFRYRGCW